MKELYWITRIDDINAAVFSLCLIFTIIAALHLLAVFFAKNEEHYSRYQKKTILYVIISFVLFVSKCFIPTKKDILMIYGVGGTMEYIKSDETEKIPDKCIQVIDLFLEEYTIDDKNITDKQ